MQNDYLQSQGIRTLGSRIRRLFERLNGPVSAYYRDHAGFEQRWFALGSLLIDTPSLDSGQAASALGQSHVAIVHVVRSMEAAGLIERTADPSDGRRKLLSLTQAGRESLARVKPLADTVQSAAIRLLEEAAPDFLEMLDTIDQALDRTSFADRIEMMKRKNPE